MPGAAANPKPAEVAPPRVREDAHRRTTQLVRASLLAGVRYGKHGSGQEGTR